MAGEHRAAFAGHALNVTSPQGRFAAGADVVSGRVLHDVHAFGKHLFYEFAAEDGGRRRL